MWPKIAAAAACPADPSPLWRTPWTMALRTWGDELGQLVIQAARQGDFLCLEVEDNGCGMTPEQVDAVLRGRPLGADTGHGIGLKNVLARLRLHFGGESNLLIESVPGQGTRITIRLPWQAVAPQTTKGGTVP